MKNSNAMSDNAELKRAAEAASQGRWNQDGFEVQNDDINDYRVARCNRLADAKFIAAANPAAVLTLIAQIERDEMHLRAFSTVAETAVAERDQLKAENERLESEAVYSAAGFDAAREEIARLKAENEALRNVLQEAADELRELKETVGFRGYTLVVLQRIDAAMSKGERS